MHAVADPVLGTASFGSTTIDVTRGSGMPPGPTTSGRVDAMAMYAGEGVGAIRSIDHAADVIAALWPVPDPPVT
jgi:hypothetical protein